MTTRNRMAAPVVAMAVGLLAVLVPACTATSASSATVTVDTSRVLQRFRPSEALGAGLDGQDQGTLSGMYTPANVRAMQSAGFKSISYRLRTELGNEAWHWNPDGTWSDPAHQQGYWTSSSTPGPPIQTSYGYRLPRRGNTVDQAANDGYSRLDDGDAASFWKSDPYLDSHFTGEPADRHPQWVVVDLGRTHPVDTVKLSWATPYALRYSVDYWDGDDPFSVSAGSGEQWRTFPHGAVANGSGGDTTLGVGSAGHDVRFVRILMSASSEQPPAGAADVRDGLGFALREVSVGTRGTDGAFHDAVRHGPTAGRQSTITVSSTDPWHRAGDLDRNTEQPGFDRVLSSGLVNDLPAVVPVAVLFGTPEDAKAEISWLAARRFPVGRVEIGEEPDGQNVLPEDYGALYAQWARALHGVRPDLQLGGPAFQTGFTEVRVWPDATGQTSWLKRFVRYMHGIGAFGDFNFLSVEWYPFDDACAAAAPHLAAEPGLLAAAFRAWAADGLAGTPKLVTEYGYSAFATRAEVDLEGALLNADFAAQFLALGGTAAFVYGYEPNTLLKEADCNSWGNNMLLQADDSYHVQYRLPAYYAARLVTQEWAQPVDELQEIHPAVFRADSGKSAPVTAYAVHRPDGRWAILVLNKDPHRTWKLRVRFAGTGAPGPPSYRGPISLVQYGREQYAWKAAGESGHPTRSLPPARSTLSPGAPVAVPPYSLSVLVGWGLAN